MQYKIYDTYFDLKTISEIAKIKINTLTRRILRKTAKGNSEYIYRKIQSKTGGGNSGFKYEILFSSLEKDIQEKILAHYADLRSETNSHEDINAINNQSCIVLKGGNKALSDNAPVFLDINLSNSIQTNGEFLINSPVSFEKPISCKAKELALYKYDIVANWIDFRKEKESKKNANIEFLSAFNNGLISEKLLNKVGKISLASLYRWNRILKLNNMDYRFLINDYNYSSALKLQSNLSDFEKQEFIKLYYNDAKLDISTAYQLLKIKFQNRGEEIKSLATFRRFARYITKNHFDFDVLSRQGEKALKDYVAPYLRRDISDIYAGDVFVADGNQLDFTVINPWTGKPARAIWLVFFDWFSFDVAGFEIMLTENTQNISSALRNAILRLNKIPKKVYIDNGRAFRGKYFSGCEDFRECGMLGVYKSLGIQEVVAKPYNGRAKVVERFFKDFTKSCPPLINSYVGNCIANKPAHLNRNEKLHKELHKNDKVPTIEQAKLIIETWLNKFHRNKPCPHDKTRSIGEVFLSAKGEGVDVDMLDELMMASEIRTVKRNTVRLFGLEYESNELYGKNDKFLIKYSLSDISKIKIYTLKGEYVCQANIVTPVKAFAKDGGKIDLYNYKMAQKMHNKMIQGTIKNTKAILGASNPFDNLIEVQKSDIIELEDKKTELRKKKKPKLEITCYEKVHLTKRKLEI